MDIDALASEKLQQQEDHARQQAELAAAHRRDYGSDGAYPDYTDAEWVEYKKGLQDELNWLGARKGKSKGKGDRRKARVRQRQWLRNRMHVVWGREPLAC